MRSVHAALQSVATAFPHSRPHILPVLRKLAFNKFNAPELVGQLLAVLEKEGLEDAVAAMRQNKIPQIVDKAWKNRDKRASSWNLWKNWRQKYPKADPNALASLEQEIEREGQEAREADHALEMVVWDMGYQGVKLPTNKSHWIWVLSKALRVNVTKQHTDGAEARAADGGEGAVFASRTAKADVTPVRQRTQYSCMAASMAMALAANGLKTNEDEVNEVMGAKPMRGASWEDALACAQHFGMRATLMVPCTIEQLKKWTDAGIPVMIAWNPEGRPWSHASLVYDVTEDKVVVADPNIPNPNETTRTVTHEEFYGKWSEKWPNYIVRRPAMAIEREITPEGKQATPSIYKAASKQAQSFWVPLQGTEGWKHVDSEILAYLTWAETYEKVKDRNVPSYSDIVDDELLADGIPEFAQSHAQAVRDWEQWNRQGWWPKPVKVRALQLSILNRKTKREFERTFKAQELRQAMAFGEQAVEDVRSGKTPEKMKPARNASILHPRTTFFKPEKAEQVAKQMQKDDPDWTYKVKHDPTGRGYSFIEIYDEENHFVGKVAKKQPKEVKQPKDKNDNVIHVEMGPPRNTVVRDMIQRGWGSGKHHNRDMDVERGRNRKPKHRQDWSKEATYRMAERVVQAWLANND